MYTNTMSITNKAAALASDAITKLYSDNFSQTFNDANDKLLEWIVIATEVNAIQEAELNTSAAEDAPEDDANKLAQQNEQNVNIRKTFYETQSIQYLYNWNKLLHYLYYFFAVSLVIALFLSPNSFSIFTQVVIAIAVLTYPYYSTYLVKHIMKFYSDIKTLLPKNVYTHYSDKHNYFSPVSVPN
jgi:hypothetical protein